MIPSPLDSKVIKPVNPVVQSLNCVFVTPWIAACQASLFFTTSQGLLKLMSIESVMPSNYLLLCLPLPLLPSVLKEINSEYSSEGLMLKLKLYTLAT